VGVALACFAAASAQAGIVLPDAVTDGDRVVNPDRTPLTLVTQEVDVEIIDQVATTTLVQVFRNDTDRPLAGTYLLPLGPTASVQEYAFWIGGRRVASTVGEKAAAKETFEGAQERGEAASLVEQTDENTFTARFTELAPGELRRFEVLYSELLPYEAGKVRYSHPLDYAESGLPDVEDLRVTVRIEDSKPITTVRAPTWPARIEATGESWLVEARMQNAVPSADFELEYEVQSTDFGLTFRTFHDGGDEGFFVAMVAPKDTDDSEIVRKDVAFVFDTSGSMGGPKIDQARRALKAALNLMNPGDGVYLLAFSGSTNPWKSRTQELDEPSRIDASKFVDSLQARGGTNIHDAVLTALKILGSSTRPTALVFLTDGNGGRNPEDVLAAVADANPDRKTRIFTFGVGADVNTAFLERLGRENRGGFTAIGAGTSIDQAVGDFYSSIAKPVLTDLSFDFGDIVPNRMYPAMNPDIYKGQRLVLTGRYRGTGRTELKVTGTIGGEDRTLTLPVSFEADDREHPWVARLWARRRADHLLADARMYGETTEIREEVIALSTEFSFATPYTSLVAHADPRIASLIPQRIKPGDPVLTVPAPRDSVAVTAFLPFGEVKDMVPVPGRDAWTTRFLVPRSVADGVYWIHIVATTSAGRTDWYRISYTVDTTAPVLVVELGTLEGVQPGDLLSIRARPVIGFLELGQEMIRSLGRDAAARAKAYVDIKEVVARIGGSRVQTRLLSEVGGESGWHGEIEIPRDLSPGLHTIEVTATDVAGNKHTVVREFTVLGPVLTADQGSADQAGEVK
jgi:Ca-activated chloride channel family protein